MNTQLLDPNEKDYPEQAEEEQLQHAHYLTRCCAFNRRGTLLASGCQDGVSVLWDFDTRGAVKVLRSHDPEEPGSHVIAVGWSLNGRRLVTAEEKGRVRVWDVEKGEVLFATKLDSPSLTVQISPADNDLVVVCPNASVPLLINIKTGTQRPIEGAQEVAETGDRSRTKASADQVKNYVALFTPDGNEIYVGSSKGILTMWHVETLTQRSSFPLPSTNAVRNLQFTRDGSMFLVSETGKIRVYNTRDGTLHREFLDQVNRTQWRKCCFSSEGNYVLGATAEKGEHIIYVWNKETGQLVKMLEGPKESLWDMAWHPARPLVVSCAHTGKMMVWAKQYQENYSAFAPNFKELEENEEYIEREDEFDLVDQQEVVKKKEEEEEAVEVDVTTLDELPCQFADVADELVYLRAVPDRDANIKQDSEDPTPDAEIRTREFDAQGQEVRVLLAKRPLEGGQPGQGGAKRPAAPASE